MLLDILIAVPVILFLLLGLRDGIVRKLVAIVMIIGGLFVGQLYQQNVGAFYVDKLDVDPSNAPVLGYLTIFFSLLFVQALLYRFAARNYKIGGVADRVIGCALGFGEGMLFVSAVFFMLLPTGFPDRDTIRDSRFYKSVVNIAPQILDVQSTFSTDSMQESIGIPVKKKHK